jgi:predicted GNAT superfamily acetyltransferase
VFYPIHDDFNPADPMTTTPPSHPLIRPLHSATEPLLVLNNDHATELSPLSLPEFDQLIRESFYSATINESEALLIAFDQSSRYDHVNFLWFRNRFEKEPNNKFVYVDRVVTSPAARGKGYARALYTDLFQRAKSAGHHRIACEVNLDPPNRVSDAFHASLNFSEVGRASIYNGAKTVRYLLLSL